MKFALVIAATLAGTALPASAVPSLTIQDVVVSGKRIEHDPNAVSNLRGQSITLTLMPRPKSVYFEAQDGEGIVVVCPADTRFDGGEITSTILEFEPDADSGGEYLDVLKLNRCG